jgi:hypothetical protein
VGVLVRVGVQVGVGVLVGVLVGVGVKVGVIGCSTGEMAIAYSTSVWMAVAAYSLKPFVGLYRSGKSRGKFWPTKGSMAA